MRDFRKCESESCHRSAQPGAYPQSREADGSTRSEGDGAAAFALRPISSVGHNLWTTFRDLDSYFGHDANYFCCGPSQARSAHDVRCLSPCYRLTWSLSRHSDSEIFLYPVRPSFPSHTDRHAFPLKLWAQCFHRHSRSRVEPSNGNGVSVPVGLLCFFDILVPCGSPSRVGCWTALPPADCSHGRKLIAKLGRQL